MTFQTAVPTVKQVQAHAKAHPLHGHKPKKKRGKIRVYMIEQSNGCGHEVEVEVADINDLAIWLAKLPNTPVKLVRLRVIKGVVYERQNDFFAWHALTGDWERGKYLPLTREGLPVDYAIEDEWDDYVPTNYFGADGKVKGTI